MAIGVVGCGSSKAHKSAPAAASTLTVKGHKASTSTKKSPTATEGPSAAIKKSSTVAKKPATPPKKFSPTPTVTPKYTVGEFCSTKKESLYKAQGLKCVKVSGRFRLENT